MKYLIQAFLSIMVLISLLSPSYVRASEEKKETYQTATLANELSDEKIDNRAFRLQKFLERRDSPMAKAASQFVKEADRLGIDWRLVAAISGNESYFGWYTPENSFNGWGWAVWTGMSYGASFTNWEEGITTVSEGLKFDYIDRGFTTVEQIGTKYAADPQWAWKVNHFMKEIEAFDVYGKDERLLALSL